MSPKRNFTLIKLAMNSLIFITTEFHKNLPTNSVYARRSGPDAGNIVPVWSLCLRWDCASFFCLCACPRFFFFFSQHMCKQNQKGSNNNKTPPPSVAPSISVPLVRISGRHMQIIFLPLSFHLFPMVFQSVSISTICSNWSCQGSSYLHAPESNKHFSFLHLHVSCK